jgi:thiol-disulfide isomerase/thioredoxin
VRAIGPRPHERAWYTGTMIGLAGRLAPLLLATLAACAGPAGRAPAPPLPVPPAPLAVAAPSASAVAEPPGPPPSYLMRGKLLGHDGRPMKLAHMHLGDRTTPVGEGGAFELGAPGRGFLPVRFTGVDHAEITVSFYFDGVPASPEITLGTYARRASFANASVLLYKPGVGAAPPAARGFPQPVTKLSGGHYGSLILSEGERLLYTVDDVARGHRVAGPDAAGYVWDGRTYLSEILRERGAFRVVLDPAHMPPAGLAPGLRFVGAAGKAARLSGLAFDAARRVEGAFTSPAWRDEIAGALAAERDPEIAAALRIAYLTPPAGVEARREEAIAVARELLGSLPADAPVWAAAPAAALAAVDLLGRSPERDAYLDRLTDGLRDRDGAGAFVVDRLRVASRAGRDDEVTRLFGVLRDRWKGTPAAHAVAFYDPARKVRPDHDAPDFDLAALPDGTRTPRGTRITRASQRGKVTLIDFWGFWCAPCVAEMGNLHDVFERHKDQGFTIVSVAVRTKMPAIKNFRASRWPMPWLHVLLDDTTAEDTIDRFEVKSYPSPILIGRDGKIVEAGDALRGDGLERAVAAALR